MTHLLFPKRLAAVAADVVGLLAFVTVGILSHHRLGAGTYALDAGLFVACWLLTGGAYDLYRRPRGRALLATWLTAVPIAVAVRSVVRWPLERDDAVFLVVALCFSLLFVAAARIAVRLARG